MNTERKNLLAVIHQAGFACDDARLYLDTHPDDGEALHYFQKMSMIKQKADHEYRQKYGPLTPYGTPENTWSRNDSPLPWNYQEVK